MSRDEIMRLAQEAGWEMDDSCVLEPQVIWYISQDQLERFAALVAAAEREACAKVCEEIERKATRQPPMVGQGCQACALAIRAVGHATSSVYSKTHLWELEPCRSIT